MIRIRTAGGALLAAGAMVISAAGAASADGAPPPSASYAGGAVVATGYAAVVRIAYTCTSVVSGGNHLFVALKQGPEVTPENFSSETTNLTSFLSTNWSSDSGPNQLTCDGKRHLQKVVLEQQPGFDGAPLQDGPVAVQVCVFDNITGSDGHVPVGGYAGGVTMQYVVVTGPPSA
jgi:hypothetical protein